MKEIRCEREEVLTAALAAGRVDEALRRHADSCPVCGDLLLVGSFFRHEGQAARAVAEPVDARVVWRRAERLARERKLERALLPIALIRKISGAAAAAAAVIAGLVAWPVVRGWLGSLDLPPVTDLTLPAVPLESILLMSATLAIGLVAFGLYAQWADS